MCCGLFKNALKYLSTYLGFVPQSTLHFWLSKCYALTNLKSAPQILVIDVLLIINGLL